METQGNISMSIRQLTIILTAMIVIGNSPRLFADATTHPACVPADVATTSVPSTSSHVLLLDDDDDDDDKPKPAGTPTSNPAASRYFCGLLDSRSSYGKDFSTIP